MPLPFSALSPAPVAVFAVEWSRELVFLACGVLGGSVLLIQTLLLLFGFGGGDDFDFDADVDVELGGSESAFGFLSVRGAASFLTFFGLSGWGAASAGWSLGATLGVSLLAGALIMAFVGWLFSLQSKLYSQGNLDPGRAVGRVARVYLRIPAGGQGKGKVTVALQGRSEQFDAVSSTACEADLPTGSEVRVVRMLTPGSFEVEPL